MIIMIVRQRFGFLGSMNTSRTESHCAMKFDIFDPTEIINLNDTILARGALCRRNSFFLRP